MFAKKTFQLLLLSIILFQALARRYLVIRPREFCSKEDFACRTPEYRDMYSCLEASELCPRYYSPCYKQKDQMCDGRLHIPTGICRGPDEKHCKGVSKGTAICSAGCAECTGRDQCAACSVNFSGKYCNETCPSGTFGQNCEFDCDYLLNEKGKFYSLCYSDDSVCESKHISDNCKATCECKRADLTCRPGWIGNHCQVPCPGFTFGRFCSKKCACVPENSVGCDKESGTCECKPQFYGERCEHSCEQVKSDFSKSNLNCLEQRVHMLSNDKAALEKKLNDQRTDVGQKMEDHKSSVEQKLSDHRTALDEHKAEVSQNFTGLKNSMDQKVRDHKSSLEGKINDQKSKFEQNLADHRTAFDDLKTGVFQNLSDHKTSVEQSLSNHRSSLEQNLANHRSSLEQNLVSHKSSLEQRLEKLTNDKAALEEQVGDHKYHLAWNFSFTCVAFVLLFVVVSWMYIKNRKLKADFRVISVRYSGKQRSDSTSEVTFSCPETTNSSDRSNLFKRALNNFRLFTPNRVRYFD